MILLRGLGLVLAAAVAPATVVPAAGQPAEPPRIIIDGRFDDWKGETPVVEDAFDASTSELDLTRIALTHDRDAVYFDLEFADIILLQGLDGTATLLFDADGDPESGAPQLGVPGVDAAVLFSPPVAGWTEGARGVTARSVGTPGGQPGEPLSSYELGVMVAPTHAANRFEVRVDRGTILPGTGELFRGAKFSVGFAYLGPRGDVEERSAVLTYEFGPDPSSNTARPETLDPLTRAPGTDFRVLSWNVGGNAIIERAEAFERILAALRPDLLLFDEVPATIGSRSLLHVVASLPLPEGRSWNAVVGPGGGRQHAVAISHHPVSLAPPLETVAYPADFTAYLSTIDSRRVLNDLQGAAEEGVSTAGFVIDLGERRILAMPIDLQCCGRLGEPEDRIRQIQAEAIHAAASAALPDLDVDGVILAGDLNLVGLRRPLDTLRVGLDVDGSDLAVLDAIQLDGRSAATWGFSGVFPTSRLDYFLYSDSELMPLKAFVFDARDLTPEWRSTYDLAPEGARASSHLPIVVDLRWAYPPRP